MSPNSNTWAGRARSTPSAASSAKRWNGIRASGTSGVPNRNALAKKRRARDSRLRYAAGSISSTAAASAPLSAKMSPRR